ncbi:unnamed protein product, partial [Rotaria socialis]
NYRDALELNTTYLVGKTLEGETMLLPKQLMEQGDVITIGENNSIENEPLVEINSHLSVEQRSDVYNDKYLDLSNEIQPTYQKASVQDILKTSYISLG